ncbi:MAG: hypothetical protein HZC28_05825 [Spirochaetes bacterium]|nr:hypothetical protein [Spirochaetota bacterium]
MGGRNLISTYRAVDGVTDYEYRFLTGNLRTGGLYEDANEWIPAVYADIAGTLSGTAVTGGDVAATVRVPDADARFAVMYPHTELITCIAGVSAYGMLGSVYPSSAFAAARLRHPLVDIDVSGSLISLTPLQIGWNTRTYNAFFPSSAVNASVTLKMFKPNITVNGGYALSSDALLAGNYAATVAPFYSAGIDVCYPWEEWSAGISAGYGTTGTNARLVVRQLGLFEGTTFDPASAVYHYDEYTAAVFGDYRSGTMKIHAALQYEYASVTGQAIVQPVESFSFIWADINDRIGLTAWTLSILWNNPVVNVGTAVSLIDNNAPLIAYTEHISVLLSTYKPLQTDVRTVLTLLLNLDHTFVVGKWSIIPSCSILVPFIVRRFSYDGDGHTSSTAEQTTPSSSGAIQKIDAYSVPPLAITLRAEYSFH